MTMSFATEVHPRSAYDGNHQQHQAVSSVMAQKVSALESVGPVPSDPFEGFNELFPAPTHSFSQQKQPERLREIIGLMDKAIHTMNNGGTCGNMAGRTNPSQSTSIRVPETRARNEIEGWSS